MNHSKKGTIIRHLYKSNKIKDFPQQAEALTTNLLNGIKDDEKFQGIFAEAVNENLDLKNLLGISNDLTFADLDGLPGIVTDYVKNPSSGDTQLTTSDETETEESDDTSESTEEEKLQNAYDALEDAKKVLAEITDQDYDENDFELEDFHKGFKDYSTEQQLEILDIYKEKGADVLLNEALNSLDSKNIVPLLVKLSEYNSNLDLNFEDVFDELNRSKKGTIINLLYKDDLFRIEDYPEQAEVLTTNLLNGIKDDTGLRSNLEGLVNDGENPKLRARLVGYDPELLTKDTLEFDDIKDHLPEITEISPEIQNFADEIIFKFNDTEDNNVSLEDITQLFDSSSEVGLDKGPIWQDVFSSLFNGTQNFSPEGLKKFTKWLNENQELIQYLQSAAKENPYISLLFSNITDNNVTLDPEVKNAKPESVINRLNDDPEAHLNGMSVTSLGFAFGEVSGDKERLNILNTLLEKAAENDKDATQLLSMINNISPLREEIDNILEYNPEHPLANLLSDPDTNASALRSYFKDIDIEIAALNLLNGVNGSFDSHDIAIDGELGDFHTLLTLLKDNEDLSAHEKIYTFFQNNEDQKDIIFEAMANGSSEIYTANNGDKEDIMLVFWDYLSEEDAQTQKDFLAAIPPYSPIHLSLIDKLAEAREKGDLDRKTNKNRDELRYLQNLEKLSDAITEGTSDFSKVNLRYIFPPERSDIDASDVVSDLLGSVEDLHRDNAHSSKLSEFISKAKNSTLTENAIIDFLNDSQITLSEISMFASALTSDSSPIFALLKEEGGDELVKNITANLFKALSNSGVSDEIRIAFLENIDPSSDFFKYLEKDANGDILDAIEDEMLEDIAPEDIQEFFQNGILEATINWYGSAISEDIVKEITAARSSAEIGKILENAEDEGTLDYVFAAITDNAFEETAPEYYYDLFGFLASDTRIRKTFFEQLDSKSQLGQALMKLIDSDKDPFKRISYTIDSQTGILDFGNDESRLAKALSEDNMLGARALSYEMRAIKALYDNSVGQDNLDMKRLIKAAKENDLNDRFFDQLFDSANIEDTDDAEELLSLITDDQSILYKELNEEQLDSFLKKFLPWISKQTDENNFLQIFGDDLSEDSLLYKALVEAGADPEDYLDAEYKNFFKGVRQHSEAANFITQSVLYNTFSEANLNFISDQLRGLKGNDIDKKVAEILDFVGADPDVLLLLTQAISYGGPPISNLTPEQAEIFLEEAFDIIREKDFTDEDDILSDIAIELLNGLGANPVARNYILQDYPVLSNYLGYNFDDALDYDDSDIADELEDLIRDPDFIKAYANRSNGRNENARNSQHNGRHNRGDRDDYEFIEDDDYSFQEDDDMSNEVNTSNQSHTDSTFEKNTFHTATEAALNILGQYVDVAGEPDYETGIFSSYFLEANPVRKLAKIANDKNFNTQAIIGTLQYIPLDEQADFIRHYMSNSNVSEETKDYLLGLLMIMIKNGEVGNRTVTKIFEDAGIDNLTPSIVEEVMDGWADAMSKYTDASISAIDDTYETVVIDTSALTDQGNAQQGHNPYGGGSFGAPGFFGGGSFGAPGFFGGGSFGAPSFFGGGSFGAPSFFGGGSFGAPSFGGGSFGAPSFGGGSFGAPSFGGGGLGGGVNIFSNPADILGGILGGGGRSGINPGMVYHQGYNHGYAVGSGNVPGGVIPPNHPHPHHPQNPHPHGTNTEGAGSGSRNLTLSDLQDRIHQVRKNTPRV